MNLSLSFLLRHRDDNIPPWSIIVEPLKLIHAAIMLVLLLSLRKHMRRFLTIDARSRVSWTEDERAAAVPHPNLQLSLSRPTTTVLRFAVLISALSKHEPTRLWCCRQKSEYGLILWCQGFPKILPLGIQGSWIPSLNLAVLSLYLIFQFVGFVCRL